MRETASITFFTIYNEAYFPGLVGLINLLRLVGHDSPIVVGDCGLTPEQRAVLADHCTLFELSSELVTNPTQYKPFAYLLNPTGIVVIIDSDMIVTKKLEGFLDAAASGKIAMFPDPESDRWFQEWQQIFELRAPPRRDIYGCCGLVSFSTTYWPDLLEQWWTACARIRSHQTYQEGSADHPTAQADQEALNALLMSEYPAGAAAFLPFEEQAFRWDFRSGVELLDPGTLRCRHRGHDLSILHACLTPKPWQLRGVRQNVYFRLLRRLLIEPDVAVEVPPRMLPVWLRRGAVPELIGSVAGQYDQSR